MIGGLILGVLNTVLTECVMEATDLPRPVASSAYSSVRFLGGAVAPPAAAELAVLFSPTAPYLAAAGAVVVALVILVLGRGALRRADGAIVEGVEEAEAVAVGDS